MALILSIGSNANGSRVICQVLLALLVGLSSITWVSEAKRILKRNCSSHFDYASKLTQRKPWQSTKRQFLQMTFTSWRHWPHRTTPIPRSWEWQTLTITQKDFLWWQNVQIYAYQWDCIVHTASYCPTVSNFWNKLDTWFIFGVLLRSGRIIQIHTVYDWTARKCYFGLELFNWQHKCSSCLVGGWGEEPQPQQNTHGGWSNISRQLVMWTGGWISEIWRAGGGPTPTSFTPGWSESVKWVDAVANFWMAAHRKLKSSGLVETCPTRHTLGWPEDVNSIDLITNFQMDGCKKLEYSGLLVVDAKSAARWSGDEGPFIVARLFHCTIAVIS